MIQKRHIIVYDKMQKGYTYIRTCAEGKHFDPLFKPELTPIQMLEYGVFEGHYLNDCLDEFPKNWFKKAKFSFLKPDIECNFFKVKSRQPLQVWQKNGWIIDPDPRGWFQWYLRYYSGRRIPDVDQIQIRRWRAFIRHKIQIEKNCRLMDLSCRQRQRQALLQWAYNPFF